MNVPDHSAADGESPDERQRPEDARDSDAGENPRETERAEALLAAYLSRLQGEKPPDALDLADGDEQLAAEIDGLHSHWERVQGVIGRLGGESMLRTGLGDADPCISLEPDDDSSALEGGDAGLMTQYSVLRELGRGAMGAVFRVRDPGLRRKLAMKVALRRDGGLPGSGEELDPSRLSRFLEEAQITGQLEHPGIVPVHELGLDLRGRAYFTMRLVRGVDLREIIERAYGGDEEWTRTRAVGVLLRVCEAVAFAHAKQVVHRDLKPTNVMVGRFGETYVMDWGLAKVLGREDHSDIRPARAELDGSFSVVETDRREGSEEGPESALYTMDGDVIGTPAYMPPEQARGKVEIVGPAADVYSVGAMLYHLLTGQRPYIGPGERVTPHTVLAAVLRGPPRAVHELAPDVPAELEAICERAMEREPAQRYESMEAMADDLRAYLEGRVVRAYETGAVAELRKWVRRNRGLAASWAAVLLVVIAGLAGFAALQAAKRATEMRLTQDAQDAQAQAEIQAERAAAAAERAEREGARAVEGLARIQVDVDRFTLTELWQKQGPLWLGRGMLEPDALAERLEDWLAEAGPIYERLAQHKVLLDELREQADEYTEEQRADDRRAAISQLNAPDEQEILRMTIATLNDDVRVSEGLERQRYVEERERARERLAQVEAELSRRRTWSFPDPELRSRHRSLRGVVETIEKYHEMAEWVRGRLEVVRSVEEHTLSGADARKRWAAAIAGVASSPAYGGLALTPVRGLLPLCADPESGLWEFLLYGSGDEPERDPGTGRWRISVETGVVLVLVPGGRFTMGTSAELERGSRTDTAPVEGPPTQVALDPFFLSKYELTEEQNVRYGGPPTLAVVIEREPVGDEAAAFPAHQLSWQAASRVASNMGAQLPSEAQWEYACRAGSTTAWHTGDHPRTLRDFANVANFGEHRRDPFKRPEEDEYPYMLPVGRLNPNAFGLHDMQGNVREICADTFYPDLAGVPFAPGSGLRCDPDSTHVAVRGASYREDGWEAHSAHRASMRAKNMNVPENGMRVCVPLP